MKDGKRMEERLIELREKKGLNQSQLAQMLHVCRQSVSDWERGKTKPTNDNLLQLSEIYGVSLDYLMGKEIPQETEEPQEPESPGDLPQRNQQKLGGLKKKQLWFYRITVFTLLVLLIVMTILFWEAKKNDYHDGRLIPINELSQDIIVPLDEEFD